jgi:peptidoglycan/xylan/chitin deacetylase (PgdA/CDA1 family)
MESIFKPLKMIFLAAILLSITLMQISNLSVAMENTLTDQVYAQTSHNDSASENEVAITIDDLPFVSMSKYDLNTLKVYTAKLLNSLKEKNVPAIGFVIESRLYKDNVQDTGLTSLLNMWLDAGMELGNHTYTHPDLNTTPLQDYERDFLRGNKIVKVLMNERGLKERYFRHPFLHTGIDLETRKEFEKFLEDKSYTIAPVTIDDADWIFNKAYETAFKSNDSLMMSKIASAYIPYMRSKFEFYEKNCRELFGRNIRQILLIHANHLNADHFGELADMMKQLNYKFVSLDRVLQDSAYKSPDTYTGRGGITWIHHWAITAGKKKDFFKGEPLTPDYVMKLADVTEE